MMILMMFQNLMQYESMHIAVPSTQPDFKMDTKINIPHFDNTIKSNELDTWLLSLEAYFETQTPKQVLKQSWLQDYRLMIEHSHGCKYYNHPRK